jgi:hypothetical protein
MRPGIYYHYVINALAYVSDENWFIVGAKDYPISGWVWIGQL